MGVIHVDVTLTNPADRSRSWTGPMLVDTGATDSVVPRPILGAIGVVPKARGPTNWPMAPRSKWTLRQHGSSSWAN